MSTSAKLTLLRYDAMIARGEFEPREEHHVELIEGEIRPMSPIGPPHEDALNRLLRWSFFNAPPDEVLIRCRQSLGLPELESVPEPDLVWARFRSYATARAEVADVPLVAEVSVSSLAYDRGPKARLYTRAGVEDYWVVDVAGRRLEVRREPRDGEYREVRAYRAGGSVAPVAFPGVELPVATLFPES